MLFRDQIEKVVDVSAGESIYFTGASLQPINDKNQIMHILAVKQADAQIRTTVSYLSVDPASPLADEVAFEKTFDAVTFERFINDMAMTIPSEKITNRLIELTYKARGISHPDGDRMTDDVKNMLHKLFLIISTTHKSTDKGYDSIDELIAQAGSNIDIETLTRGIAKSLNQSVK